MARKLANWLEAYLVYTYSSESPEEYHQWVGLSVVAGALRRQVFFDLGYFLAYPNEYVILVGPPGRCKKSTAMRIGRRLLSKVPEIQLTVDSTTRERLISDMAVSFKNGQSAMTGHSSEFASLVASSGMDMVNFLTDIYDSPDEWEHRSKTGGPQKIKAPCLNLLGATTPMWISSAMPLDTIGVGLTSRIIFVYQDTPRPRPPIPKLTAEQKVLGDLLIEDLCQISTIEGEYVMTKEAETFHEEWYLQQFALNASGDADPRLSGYYERKQIHLIKASMAVAAAQRDDRVIELADIEGALAILDSNEERMYRVFAHVGKNPLNQDIEAVFAALLKRQDGITLAELLEKFNYSVRKDELAEVLETLITMRRAFLDNGGRYVAIREST